MVSKDLSVHYSFGIPIKTLEGGMIIDVDRYIHSPGSISGDTTKIQQFMLSLGQMSSGMEHGIFEQLYNKTGTSAVKALSVANSQGIPIYTVNAGNVANVLPVLQISEQVKTDIQNAVNAGKTVTVSKTNVTVDTWTGAGYVILDPNTGAGAYMISGGFAGGGSDVDLNLIISKLHCILTVISDIIIVVASFYALAYVATELIVLVAGLAVAVEILAIAGYTMEILFFEIVFSIIYSVLLTLFDKLEEDWKQCF